jgi:phage host-nuclease inhibitor protein Gam
LEREDIEHRTSILETQKNRLSIELQKYRTETNDRFAQLEAEYNDDLKQRDQSINQLEQKLRNMSSENKTVIRERDSL